MEKYISNILEGKNSFGWGKWYADSCNNVAPVTNCVSAELQRGPIRHNGAK
jgi:hypothetical protein